MTDPEEFAPITIDGPVATLTLNRPRTYNAFDKAAISRVVSSLLAVGQDENVRAVIVTGAGKAFCAGGDLRAALAECPEKPGDYFHQMAAVYHQAIVEIRTMPKPVIAAINGPAAGGGFSLALACDLRVMEQSAFLRQAYTSNGLCIDGGGTFTLPRIVGLARALEIVMFDEPIPAARALEWGLVHRVAPDERLLTEAREMALRLAEMPTATLGRIKRLLNRSFDASLETQLEEERRGLAESANTAEGREGLRAFSDKRKPSFSKTR